MTTEQLRLEAIENFTSIYDNSIEQDDLNIRNDFDECWAQLKTDEERNDFRINCCYYKENGKCIVYFHVFDYNKYCYRDITLKQYRLMNRDNIEVYNCVY